MENGNKKKPIKWVITGFCLGCMLGYFAEKLYLNLTPRIFESPVIKLDSVEVDRWGWWYFENTVKPTHGTSGNYGSPLYLAFMFEIENPNPYPVMMKNLEFTVAFEEFDIARVFTVETEEHWIPVNKTSRLRMPAMLDMRETLLRLLDSGESELKEKGISHWELLEKWWVEVLNFSFPIQVKGSATFCSESMSDEKPVSFSDVFPQSGDETK